MNEPSSLRQMNHSKSKWEGSNTERRDFLAVNIGTLRSPIQPPFFRNAEVRRICEATPWGDNHQDPNDVEHCSLFNMNFNEEKRE